MNVNRTLRHFGCDERSGKFPRVRTQFFNGEVDGLFPHTPYFIGLCGKEFHTVKFGRDGRKSALAGISLVISLRHLAASATHR